MSRFTSYLVTVRRHRTFQIVVSMGIIGTTLISIHNPSLALEGAALNALTNLIWLWEPNHH